MKRYAFSGALVCALLLSGCGKIDHTDGELCAGGDAQNVGAGDGIGKERLEQKAGYGERSAQNHCRQTAGQPNLPENAPRRGVLFLSEEQPQNLRRGEPDASAAQIDGKEQHQQRSQQQIPQPAACRRWMILQRVFPPIVPGAGRSAVSCRLPRRLRYAMKNYSLTKDEIWDAF